MAHPYAAQYYTQESLCVCGGFKAIKRPFCRACSKNPRRLAKAKRGAKAARVRELARETLRRFDEAARGYDDAVNAVNGLDEGFIQNGGPMPYHFEPLTRRRTLDEIAPDAVTRHRPRVRREQRQGREPDAAKEAARLLIELIARIARNARV